MAKKLGYTLVKIDGQDMYCRTSVKTGSRLQKETVCLTAADIDILRQQTRERLSNPNMQARPPQGH